MAKTKLAPREIQVGPEQSMRFYRMRGILSIKDPGALTERDWRVVWIDHRRRRVGIEAP